MKTYMKSSPPMARRLIVASILLGLTVIVAGAVTVSRQRDIAAELKVSHKSNAEIKAPANFTTIKVGGQDVQVNTQTGEIKELTPEEAARLAEGLKRLINPSAKGVEQVRHDDGSVSMNLDGRFQNVTVVRINTDGSVTQSCVDTPESAGAFFGINPELIRNNDAAPAKRSKNRVN